MADVFQFEIDENHQDANYDPDDNENDDEIDRNDVSLFFSLSKVI